ncbi:MAG: zf-HC2 domain-containing protein [Coriobacteriia bacterium]|nr:zf-HC2 domain-containing protein [Coriobacteriia bacterium]
MSAKNASIDCEACRESLESYIGGDLEAARAREVAEHLAVCEACAASYESTRRVVAGLTDLGGSFVPRRRFEVPQGRASHVGSGVGRGWRVAAAAGVAAALLTATAASVPAVAEQLPLPVGRQLAELREDRAELEAETERLAEEVERLEIELREIEGERMPQVNTAEPALPPEVNDAVQGLVVRFVRAQYERDASALRAMATERLRAEIDRRPGDYLKEGATVTFAQTTDVSLAQDGTYLVFVRLSDAEFHDSQYQENFTVIKAGDAYLVDSVEMDA